MQASEKEPAEELSPTRAETGGRTDVGKDGRTSKVVRLFKGVS